MTTNTATTPWYRNHLIRDAISQAIYDEMERDPSIHLFGEGAEVKVHYDAPNIERDFGDRVHTLPISEDGNLNFAVGASLVGVKPIVDVITADFLYRAMDSIVNTAAKLNFLRPNEPERTIVIRSEFLIGAPTMGQRPEALFAHIPGLKVVIPSTPRDAHGLMRTALMDPGITIFFEDREIKDDLIKETDTRLFGPIGFGYAMLRGDTCRPALAPDMTIVAYGLMRQRVEETLKTHPRVHLIDFYDLQTIYPIDWLNIKGSVSWSKKLLIIEPDVQYGGVGAEIAATIAEELPGTLIRRLGARRETIPADMTKHDSMIPTESEIIDAINSF